MDGFVLALSQVDSSHVSQAGGKGASLGELHQAGAPVPPGFVIVSAAFHCFMQGEHWQFVKAVLRSIDAGACDVSRGAQIAEHMATVPMPGEVAEAISVAVGQLQAERVSVRSSATCEDSGTSAWAGQLDTYLNVSPEKVADQIRCWLSMFGEPALAYGATHGYGAGKFGVAVVVQQMVASQVSGVGFSVHPVTQEPNVMLVEACLGQGEAIVSGRIVPDQFAIDRNTHAILNAVTGAQREGLFMDPADGSLQWSDLQEQGKAPKLTDAQVTEYGRMLSRIHDHYGHPVDTEWAFDGQFYLLQSRPITTLADEYQERIIDDMDRWLHIVRRPMSLLDTSIWAHWLDAAHLSPQIQTSINRAMSIQDAGGMANHFVDRQAQEQAIDHIADLCRNDRNALIDILKTSHEVYRVSLERIEQHADEFRDMDQAAEFLSTVAQYTTVVPAWTLLAYEQHDLNDQEVRSLAEGLRSHSLYPTIEHKIVAPLAAQVASKLGFAAPEMAPQLMTWNELHRHAISLDTLETRWAEIQAGKHFIFRSIDGQDSVRFVSQTGYLLMRLARQWQMLPNTNPDVLSGQAAWPGVCRARARVVMSADGSAETIEEGEVLVSIQSNPTLMPLLRHCGAVVTDDGGIVCHAAIIARELRKPTLIGTGQATTLIRTGDLVEVDTYAGQVRIIERANVD